ncbi:MAG TPA: hypothetical protein VFC19_53695 [Candidatus Limnocylindrales bacterium]|nr:hypothetical protein [Candidatus Limnocylindrales bacterium]
MGSKVSLIDGPAMLGAEEAPVASATITTFSGQEVEATVAHGWFFAWWPFSRTAIERAATASQGRMAWLMRAVVCRDSGHRRCGRRRDREDQRAPDTLCGGDRPAGDRRALQSRLTESNR